MHQTNSDVISKIIKKLIADASLMHDNIKISFMKTIKKTILAIISKILNYNLKVNFQIS